MKRKWLCKAACLFLCAILVLPSASWAAEENIAELSVETETDEMENQKSEKQEEKVINDNENADLVITDNTKPAAQETPDPAVQETPDPTAQETPDPAAQETPDPAVQETPDPAVQEKPDPAAQETPDPTVQEKPDSAAQETPDPAVQEKPEPEKEYKEVSEVSGEEIEIPEGEDVFFLEGEQPEISTFSFDNSSNLPVSSVRYDKFRWSTTNPGTASCPNLGTGIKYIQNDDQNPDGEGKWRYVYCLQFLKDSPNGITMSFQGWTNRKIAYALYYGAVYYYQTCRYAPYSTGDWQMDYFVTQMAVHILNGEFTLSAFNTAINKASSATAMEKAVAYDRVTKIVNGANNAGNYSGFTSDGWLDMNYCNFSLSGYSDSWSLSNGNYYSGGYFKPTFTSYYGYDFREQITGYDISVPGGVNIRKSSNKTYSDFDLYISQSQYKNWQLTGKDIPISVTASVPRYWGGGIYKSGASSVQNICFLTWDSSGGTSRFTQSTTFHVPKSTFPLTIYKKDKSTGKALSGAKFSLWSYNGSTYNRKLGDFSDRGDGSYSFSGIDYTSTVSGWFLIKEDAAPKGYEKEYQLYNTADIQNYNVYGGREILLTADGITYDGVPNATIFNDPVSTFKAIVRVKKYDVDTSESLTDAGFSIYEYNADMQAYKKEPLQKLTYLSSRNLYQTESPVEKTDKNQGKFKIVETKMPEGYKCPWSKEFIISENGTVTLDFEAPNYPVRKLIINKKIKTDDINWSHGNPTFFYTVSGKDINGESHTWHRFVEFRKSELSEERKGYVIASTQVENMPAGKYTVAEDEGVLRYILTDVKADTDNVEVNLYSKGNINGIEKVSAEVNANLQNKDGEVTFTNEKVVHDELSDNALVSNKVIE